MARTNICPFYVFALAPNSQAIPHRLTDVIRDSELADEIKNRIRTNLRGNDCAVEFNKAL